MLSVIWGGSRRGGDLGHLPRKWVIVYTCHVIVSLSSIFIAVTSGYMLLPNPNLPFISFLLIQNGYKQLPNPPGTQGFARHYWCLLPWWWGCQETSTHKSRGEVLRGSSISRQTVIVCKVKISGNENMCVYVCVWAYSTITVILLSFPFYSHVQWKLLGAVKLFTTLLLQYLCTFISELLKAKIQPWTENSHSLCAEKYLGFPLQLFGSLNPQKIVACWQPEPLMTCKHDMRVHNNREFTLSW